MPTHNAGFAFPRVHLAIDNCFASKRWTEPIEWMEIARDLGLRYVEASAYNECDPLYSGPGNLRHWSRKVEKASEKTGVKVANLYSGHGTYSTLGLAHTDRLVRSRFLEKWLKPMVRTASELDAGLGFFCHAFADSILQSKERYAEAERNLYRNLAELALYARENGCKSIGVEQMYSPHQIPWTIEGAKKLLREVNGAGDAPFYLTLDVGHQCGQRRFLRPGRDELQTFLRKRKDGCDAGFIWLGPKKAFVLAEEALAGTERPLAKTCELIEREMDVRPYLFSSREDGDTWSWLETLGAYSPIIHLQQTDGRSSAHRPFTREFNMSGIISGERVLRSLGKSFQRARKHGGKTPPPCKDVFLTIEVFSGTADINHEILKRLKESASYWRAFIPEDGIALDELIKKIDGDGNGQASANL